MRPPEEQIRHVLASYERGLSLEDGAGERLFRRILGLCLLGLLGLGALLLASAVPEGCVVRPLGARCATYVWEPPPPPPAEPVLAADEPAVEDLTENPLLGRAESHPAEALPEPAVPAEEPDPAPRRVYGLRRVYARGLGSGSGGAGSIVSKRGNTLAKEPDTLRATPEDLHGALVALSTVTTAPELLSRVKPDYTEEMRVNEVEGIVTARLLVDIDGTVKAVEITADLGFGSRESAESAFRKLRFKPARCGVEPVAVWIRMKYRFVLQG